MKWKRVIPWLLYVLLLSFTIGVLVPVVYVVFMLGIAIHDTIYLANPELGPDGWMKYTGMILEPVMWVTWPLFMLLGAWFLACTWAIIRLMRGKRAVEHLPGG